MRIHVFFATVLTVFSISARAAEGPVKMKTQPMRTENFAGTFVAVDSTLAEAQLAIKAFQDCLKLTTSLRTDLATNQRELKAEFGGQIPSAFNELLQTKRTRLDKQQSRCLQAISVPGQLYLRAHDLLRQIEPRSLPGISARFQKVEAGRVKYNKLIAEMKGSQK